MVSKSYNVLNVTFIVQLAFHRGLVRVADVMVTLWKAKN